MSWSGRELATIAQRLRQATPCPAFSITSVSELWFVTLNPMHSFSQIFEILKQSTGSYYNLMPTVKRQWNWWPYNVIVWFSEVFNVHLLNEELPEVQQDNLGHRWFEKQEPPCLVDTNRQENPLFLVGCFFKAHQCTSWAGPSQSQSPSWSDQGV